MLHYIKSKFPHLSHLNPAVTTMEFTQLVTFKDKITAAKQLVISSTQAVVARLSSSGQSDQENCEPDLQSERVSSGSQAECSGRSEGLRKVMLSQPQEGPRFLRPHPQLVPDFSEESKCITPEEMSALVAEIPARFRFCTWRLAYSTARDGISLRTLYRCMPSTNSVAAVLVVKDRQGFVFGAFTPVPFKVHPGYYGTGETLVFQCRPEKLAWRWWSTNPSEHRSDFFCLSTPESIAFGSSTEKCALWLDEELLRGTSGYCMTFNSPCLAGSEEFAVNLVEVWALE